MEPPTTMEPVDLDEEVRKSHYRAIFLSDIHLGTRGCQADRLVAFLKAHTCDVIYLVGDIVDGWRLRSNFYWPQAHNNVVRRFLTLVRRGSRLVYVTGNHEYVHERTRLPLSVGYRFLRWFHRPGECTLVTTSSHRRELEARGFEHLRVWGRGVDTSRFRPLAKRVVRRRPRLLYVGRVAVEKNIEAFLSLPVDADKVVVGDGPHRADYQRRFPEAEWCGYRYGEELVASYADADAFVFPSVMDTFGLVMLEAMACGTPVAAFPVTGPGDVVRDGVNGALDEDLGRAVERALDVSRQSCRDFALASDWRAVAERFLRALPTG